MSTAVLDRPRTAVMPTPTLEAFLATQPSCVVVAQLPDAVKHYTKGHVPPEFVVSCTEHPESMAWEYARTMVRFDLWNCWIILDTEDEYDTEVADRAVRALEQIRKINRHNVGISRLRLAAAQIRWDENLDDLLAAEEQAAHDAAIEELEAAHYAAMEEIEQQLENDPRGRRHARTHRTTLH